MSDTTPLAPLLARSHHKFVAFSAVGVAMVCVPLMQVLQVQQADLQQLQSNRALLDPVAAAVHTQYGLLAHQGLARQVLQGATEQEPPRAAAAQEVNIRLGTLTSVLTDGAWGFALAEARMLAGDWRSLAQQVAAQRISSQQSDEAHRVRVEQTLQVVDLVTLSQAPDDRSVQASQQAWLASTRLLVRLAADIAQTGAESQTASSVSATTERVAAQVRLAARLQNPPQAEVTQALAEAQTGAAELMSLLSESGIGAAPQDTVTRLARARRAALKAQQQLFHALHQAHDQALVAQTAALQQQRQWLLSVMAALAALATALGMTLWRALRRAGLRHPAQDQGDDFDSADLPRANPGDVGATQASPHRAETGRLLQRLRENAAPIAPHREPRLDQEDSLPPPR